ncbi:MAG TPA: lipocalin family protein [Tepidisphaeraceae bacterium]|jgi:hypothetical protein
MARKGRRLPVVSTILLLVTLFLMIRSIWVEDTLGWRSTEDQRSSAIATTWGASTAQLGLTLFYDQKLTPARNPGELNKALDASPPGLVCSARSLPNGSGVRLLALGWERRWDTRAESFANYWGITLPLWLLAAFFAIEPVRYLLAWRRERRQHAQSSQAQDTGEKDIEGGGMRIGIVIALVIAAMLIGAAAMYFFVAPHSTQSAATPAMGSSTQAPDQPPIHPIVGVWRIRIAPIIATYTFGNDGNFTLTFRGIPGPRGTPAEHQAAGTWKVSGDILSMTNTSSNSDYSVVGEVEEAKILSVSSDSLILENRDRKGRPERLEFEPVRPFAKGKFDNPGLLGEWRCDQFTLELKPSGDAVMHTTRDRSGQWSQEGNKLRIRLDPLPPTGGAARRAQSAAMGQLNEPGERVFEIQNVSPEHNMLLLHPMEPPGADRLTFYRVN